MTPEPEFTLGIEEEYFLVDKATRDVVAFANPVAVAWTALGLLAYMFAIPAEWIRVLVTLVATAARCWGTMYLLTPHFTELALASQANERHEAVEDLDWQLALR